MSRAGKFFLLLVAAKLMWRLLHGWQPSDAALTFALSLGSVGLAGICAVLLVAHLQARRGSS